MPLSGLQLLSRRINDRTRLLGAALNATSVDLLTRVTEAE
jgi:hypothetical protein